MSRWHHPVRALDNWWENISPKRRIDRNAGNMCMLIGLMAPTLSIVLKGPAPSSVVSGMSDSMQMMMSAAIFLGCGIKLHGALCGARWYFPKTILKKCYRYGYSGAPAAVVGLGVYSYYIFVNLPNFYAVIGAMLTPMMGLGIGIQAVFYWLESRRLARNENEMLTIIEEGPS